MSRVKPLYGALFAMAWVPFEASLFIVVLLFWNFVQTGGQGGLNTLITQVYNGSARKASATAVPAAGA